MATNDYPKIEEEERGSFVLINQGGVRTYFDEIEATGYGYWDLRLNGEQVAIVGDLAEWPSESVRTFRNVQFGKRWPE